jgi:hypothetical protein
MQWQHLTPQASATAAARPGMSGEAAFGSVTETLLMQSSSLFSNTYPRSTLMAP